MLLCRPVADTDWGTVITRLQKLSVINWMQENKKQTLISTMTRVLFSTSYDGFEQLVPLIVRCQPLARLCEAHGLEPQLVVQHGWLSMLASRNNGVEATVKRLVEAQKGIKVLQANRHVGSNQCWPAGIML